MNIVLGMALGTIVGGLIGLIFFLLQGNMFFTVVTFAEILVGVGIVYEIRRMK